MPLPFLIVAAVGAAIVGIKKGLDASETNEQAESVGSEASTIFEKAKKRLNNLRDQTNNSLDELGGVKLKAWDKEMGDFVTVFEQIKNVKLTGAVADDSFARSVVSEAELLKLRDLSVKASEIVSGGLGALGSGALAGVAAYGGAMTFGAASTGAAISGLTGVAATNATLAWLGGGSLAAGGMGMAGGMAVLGGLVAGPLLLVGGFALSAKANANLAKAQANRAEARKAAAEMDAAGAALRTIARLADQYTETLTPFRSQFRKILKGLRTVIQEGGTSFTAYSQVQKEVVWLAVEAAGVMKKLLETPLLKKDGSLNPKAGTPLELPDAVTSKMAIIRELGAGHA